jgi:TonB-linked SusC/RagA family outer membrane protein
MFGALVSFAQGQVTGKVTSADDGSALPGVNVVEKGTGNGATTDADGNYSIKVGANATLVFSFVGYSSQEIAVGTRTVVDLTLQSDVTALSEVVVVGYGSQEKKEITSAVVSLSTKEFNQGNVNDPTQLLQGKVAGLSIYNRGGDPNSSSTIRLRGISTVGANTSPLVVIDGVLGASLDNVDPNDIESINVLKDGSAAAIYGSRGSSGVILVTTKRGSNKSGGLAVNYNGYVASASIYRKLPVMTADQYIAAGGNNLGTKTDWQDLVTRNGVSTVHNLALSGGNQTTSFRISGNYRKVDGILKYSGFDQLNTRANLTHSALQGKLRFDVNLAFTDRNSNFSFNEALRYATVFNPTAPVRFSNGGYYQAILFDNFNPVAILEQNTNTGKKKNLNFNAKVDYSITDDLVVSANFGRQTDNVSNTEFYSRNSLFRGFNRGGLARRYVSDRTFSLFEGYATYSKSFDKFRMDLTGGYSYQEDQFEDLFVELGNFPNDALGANALETSGDRISGIASLTNISSSKTPVNKIIAFFARANFTFDDAIFLNASVRREGSSKLGKNNQIGIFPAVGVGVNILKYADISSLDVFKFRAGYGVTGALPNESGLAQEQFDYSFNGGGNLTRNRLANPDLKWEQKAELNLGLDFGFSKKITGSLDVYTRNIKDFIINTSVESTSGTSNITRNAGSLKTNGIELNVSYNNVQFGEVSWTPGIVLSSYKTTLESYIPGIEVQARAPLGAPGQSGVNQVKIAVGEEIGQLWGPVFASPKSGDGSATFVDLNGDGVVKATDQTFLTKDADYKKLGNGIPSLELGFTNRVTFKNWDFNAFFRGAFGHSLSNNFRAFYEPIDLGAINSYNRIATNKAVSGLTESKFSSLYVEKADFLRLDNLTAGYNFKLSQTSGIKSVRLYVTGQNLFVITNYTGIDPDPALTDQGAVDNGGFLPSSPDVLAPGIDRRNNYFTARTFTFGVSIGL